MSYWDTLTKQVNPTQNDAGAPKTPPPVLSPIQNIKPSPKSKLGFWGDITAKNDTAQPAAPSYWDSITKDQEKIPSHPILANLPPPGPIPTDYDSLAKLYTTKKDTFDSNLSDFEKQKADYEKEVADWNAKGAAPKDVYDRLHATALDLQSHADSLNTQQKDINDLVDPISEAAKKKQMNDYIASGGPSIGPQSKDSKPAPLADQPTATDYGQNGSGLPTIQSDTVPGSKIPVLGKFLTKGAEGYNVVADSLNNAGNKFLSMIKALEPGQKNPSTPIQKATKVVGAATGVLGVAWALPSAILKSGEGIPVAGKAFEGVNYLFGKLGQLGDWEANSVVSALPISDASKKEILPLASELAGLLNQIAGGKIAHETLLDATERTTEIRGKIKDKIIEGYKGFVSAKPEDFKPIEAPKLEAVPKPAFKLAEEPKLEEIKSPRDLYNYAEGESQVIPFNKINIRADEITAAKDVKAGRKSQSGLPALVEKQPDGTYDIIDGKHRVAEQSGKGNEGFLAMTDEKLYRQLAAREESFKQTVRSHDRTGTGGVREYTRKLPTEKTDTPQFKKAENDLITTNILQKLGDRNTVSKQYISDLTNSAELKQQERDIIREALKDEGNTVNVKSFQNKVRAELLPLKRTSQINPRYENISLSDAQKGNVANYSEHVYQSPIKTSAGDIHFAPYEEPSMRAGTDSSKNYFGHTRVEDMGPDGKLEDKHLDRGGNIKPGTTRRIIEVQSDLYQKGNLEREQGGPAYGGKGSLDMQKETAKRSKEIAKLQQYSNPTAHFRMVREEVKQAAIDGKTKLQFPTGETAMKIEGLGQNAQWEIVKDGKSMLTLNPEMLNDKMLGHEVRPRGAAGDEWIITEILPDGKFKAVTADSFDAHSEALSELGFYGPDDVSGAISNKNPKMSKFINDEMNTETFDISGKVDTNNPIYRFYEKDLGRYLKNKYDAKLITDKQGVTWYEMDVKPEYKGPVEAFNRAKGDEKLVLNTEGLKKIEEYQKRLKVKFDTHLLDAILTVEGDKAYGVTYDNSIGLAKDHTAYTPDHEVTHLLLRNIDSIPLFKGISAEEVFIEARQKYGDLSKSQLDEKIAEGYETYKAERDANKPTTFSGKLLEFFKRFYDGVKDIFTAGPDGINKLEEFYRRTAEGKGTTPVELKSEGKFPKGNEPTIKGPFKVKPAKTIPNELDSLAQEARKYKNVDEFKQSLLGEHEYPESKQMLDEKRMEAKQMTGEEKITLYRGYDGRTKNRLLIPGDYLGTNEYRAKGPASNHPFKENPYKPEVKTFQISKKDLAETINGDYIYSPNGIRTLDEFYNKAIESAPKFKTQPGEDPRKALAETEQKFTENEKKTIAAFDKSSGQESIGSIGEKEAVIGTYGKNAIERKTAVGQGDRLPMSELEATLPYAKDEYRSGTSGFRKDNTVHVAKMPDGERRAIVTRVNADGKAEVINFFKIGRNYFNFITNLKKFGIPAENRTRISSLEEKQSNPLTYGDKQSLPNPPENVKPSVLANNDSVMFTADKADRALIQRGMKELTKMDWKEAFVEGLKIKLPDELQQKAEALSIRKQALDDSPLKGSLRLIAKRGEFKGRVAEVTGKDGKGTFARFGDRYLSEITGIDDTEKAREMIDKYGADTKKLEQDVKDFQLEKNAFLKDARAARDLKIENQKIGASIEKNDRTNEKIKADAEKRKARIEEVKKQENLKQEELKQKQVDLSNYQKQVESAHLKEGQKKTLLTKFKAILQPIEQTDPVTKKIYLDWERAKLKAKESGNLAYDEFKNKPNDDFQEVVEYESGKKTPWVFQAFEDLFTEAKRAGINFQHKENYIPHVYNEKPEQIKKAVERYMIDHKATAEEIQKFKVGGDVPERMAIRIKTNPFFMKMRTFRDYATAMKYGITPRFQTVAEHIAYYKEELGKIIANRNMIDALIKEGKVLDAFDAPESWIEVKLPGKMRRTYYAEKNLADALNGQFRDEENLTFVQEVTKRMAKASQFMQEVKLSAGVPGTNINFFSIGQAIKSLTVGLGEASKLNVKGAATSIKAATAFIRANFNGISIKWLKAHQRYIDLMADQNIPMANRIDDYTQNYKQWKNLFTLTNLKEGAKSIKTWGRDVKEATGFKENTKAVVSILDTRALGVGKDVFDKFFNEKTFNSMMPQMQIQIFKDIYERALSSGMGKEAAAKFAGDTVKAEFGTINQLGRTQNAKDVFAASFFAPKFRESIINVFANAAKSYTTEFKNPAFGRSRSLVLGMILSYISYNYLNQQLNNGDNMWDNEAGREFQLKIPLPGGRIVYTDFMPSVLSFVRNMGSAAIAFASGNNKVGIQKTGTLFSMPIKTASEVISNSDYFGRPIYAATDDAKTKATKAIEYMGLSVTHPYFSELLNYFQGKQDIYKTIVTMTELPLKFSTEDKANISRAYDAKIAKQELNATERSKITDTLDIYDRVQTLKADNNTAEAGRIIDELSDDQYKQYQVIMKYEQIAALKKAHQTDEAKALGDTMTDDEFLQYNAIKQLRANVKRADTIQKNADKKKTPVYDSGQKVDSQSLLESVVTYANAIGSDPVTAFNRIFTGQKIRRVDNGAIIVERMSILDSTKIKKDQGGNNPTMKLDHTIPLELGGSNDISNLKLVPTDVWNTYTPVENKLGKLLRASKISKSEAQRLINSFKAGEMTADDIMKL